MDLTAACEVFTNVKTPMKARFRALFTLRNLGGPDALKAMEKVLQNDQSALLKHEVAYCLGQMGDKAAVSMLKAILEDTTKEDIVRHEAGEALGAIGDPEYLPFLEKFLDDPSKEVADTCVLAVKKIKYNVSGEIHNQQANILVLGIVDLSFQGKTKT